MSTYGSHQPETFNGLESKASLLLPTLNLMKSSKNVDQWLIDCDFLSNLLQSMMSFTYLNSSDVSEFQQRSLNVKMRMGRPGPGLGHIPHGLKVIFLGHGPTQINVLPMALMAQWASWVGPIKPMHVQSFQASLCNRYLHSWQTLL